jgi:hypothetical protein
MKREDLERWLAPSPALAVDEVGGRSSVKPRPREGARRLQRSGAAHRDDASAPPEERNGPVLADDAEKRRRG